MVCALVHSKLATKAQIPWVWLLEHQTIRTLADKIQRSVVDKQDSDAKRPPELSNAVSLALAQLSMRDRYASSRGLVPLSFQQVSSLGGAAVQETALCCHENDMVGCC